MSDSILLLILAFVTVVLIAAFIAGRSQGREEIVHRLLGMKRANNRWEVAENTRIMGMKWVLPHYVFTDGTRARRVNWKEEHWEFDDGTVPPQVVPGLDEVPGHWELSDGQKIDPLQMNLRTPSTNGPKNASKVSFQSSALPVISELAG